MDDDTRWAMIERERLSLADLLTGLDDEQWETESLCTEWRVRDVAGHVAMTPAGDPSTWEMVRGVVARRGDLWAMGRDVAIAWAARPTEQIVDTLRFSAASRRMPRITNAANILLDVVVHGQDIAVPLGVERTVPTETGIAAFERVWSMGWPFWARRRFDGLTLTAVDADVRVGHGPEVTGPLSALLLLLTGRTEAAVPMLTGAGVAQLGVGPERHGRRERPAR